MITMQMAAIPPANRPMSSGSTRSRATGWSFTSAGRLESAQAVRRREPATAQRRQPGLETKHPKSSRLAQSLKRESADSGACKRSAHFGQWTRDNIKFERGDFRGALFAVENRTGDCEESACSSACAG